MGLDHSPGPGPGGTLGGPGPGGTLGGPGPGGTLGGLRPAPAEPRLARPGQRARYRAWLATAARQWAPLLSAVVTLLVTVWRIGVPSFWRDEAATLAATHRPLAALFPLLGHQDAVHGSYYLLMWCVWRLGGTSALAVRLPSALAMAAAAGTITVIGRRLVSRPAGLAAGLVFAALPPVSWFGQDARPFALETAVACAASYLFVRVLAAQGRQRRRWLAGYAGSLVLLGLANLFGLLLIWAHGLTLALRWRSGGRWLVRGWLAAVAAACLALVPLGLVAWPERGQISWLSRTGLPVADLGRLFGSAALAPDMLLIMASALAVGAVAGRAQVLADWPGVLPALSLPWLVLPPAALIALSQWQAVYTFRYIVFCLPAAALLAGTALAALARLHWLVAAAALLLIVLVGLPVQFGERGPFGHGDGIRRLDQILVTHARPGDVLVYPGYGGLRALAAAYPYGLATMRDISLAQPAAKSGTIGGINASVPVIQRRMAGALRVWVPLVTQGRSVRRISALQGVPFQQVRAWDTGDNIWLVLYVRSGQATVPGLAHPLPGPGSPPARAGLTACPDPPPARSGRGARHPLPCIAW